MILHNLPVFSTSVTGWRITRQGGVSKCPGGWVYWGFLGCRLLSVMGWWSVLPGRLVLVLSSGCPPCRDRAFQWLSSVPCSCAGGWPVKRCFLEYNADSELAWSLLETCLTSVCVAAAYQALPWRASCVPGQPVMRTCRWSSLISRATVMSARDTCHTIYIYISAVKRSRLITSNIKVLDYITYMNVLFIFIMYV